MTSDNMIFNTNDPFDLARKWLEEAALTEPRDPNAIALATCDAAGLPDVRMVLLKDIEGQGEDGAFVFYTNYESEKGRQLLKTGKAAFVMHWKSLNRQIRVRGHVSEVEADVADAYYNSRPLESRIGAWASQQSRPLASREALIAEVEAQSAKHGASPGRPPYWGGFRIHPEQIEFWADGEFRLHDRFRWVRLDEDTETRENAKIIHSGSSRWAVSRLFP